MTIYLRQSTASQEVLLGPAIDDTDFKTPKTGLTIANTDIKVWKAGATTLANKNSGGATEISGGYYYGVFDATDTDTAGSMRISIKVATALIIFMDVCVLPAQVYDSLVLGTDLLDANASQAGGTAWGSGAITAASIATDALTAAKFASDVTTELQSGLATAAALATVDGIVDNLVSGIIFGAAATGTLSTTQASTNLTGYANDQLIGRPVIWLTGACEGEASVITDYVATSGVLTFDALTTAPGNGDTFKIV